LLERVDYRRIIGKPQVRRNLSTEAPPEVRVEPELPPASPEEIRSALSELIRTPTAERLFHVMDALRVGFSLEEVHELTKIDPWFLRQLAGILAQERELQAAPELGAELLLASKRLGFGDAQIAELRHTSEAVIRERRHELAIAPVYGRVDTCSAEFIARTPYLYSTYETESEAEVSDRRKVIILGGGPNRIGQGIEFDYCCCQAAFALSEIGLETIMVNCNPETVSTDYDTSDRLYFEPLTLEDVLEICRAEAQSGELLGVIVQFGGQTPLKLAVPLERAGIRLLGTPADAIDRAEDRERFEALLGKLNLKRPNAGIARSVDEAVVVSQRLGLPVLVRPSYVLGGRAMMICHTESEVRAYSALAMQAAQEAGNQILLIDEFLKSATEVDVDCVSDGRRCVIGGVMQHVEEAGVHSGDSTSILPPSSLDAFVVAEIEEITRRIAIELGVVGLMNVQYAIKDGEVFIIEVNPRASRTVPFVSKATGQPLAKIAAQVMAGRSLDELGIQDAALPKHVSVKESVFPFQKFPGVDTLLGPEMRSTGEVMGIAATTAEAFGKALLASGSSLPKTGRAFVSVQDDDKLLACLVARRLRNLGFEIVATRGTAKALTRARIPVVLINKVAEGAPHVVEALARHELQLVINTTRGAQAIRDSYAIRRNALIASVPYFTTMSAALALVDALEAQALLGPLPPRVRSLQEWHALSSDLLPGS
jgi:carbamoyl-phosphate synthase large subunit